MRKRAGFTLLEMVIVVALFVVVLVVMGVLLQSSWGVYGMGATQLELTGSARKCLDRIVRDLKHAGRVGGYPYIFENGVAEGDFSEYAHPPIPIKHVPEGSEAYGPVREMVFKVPEDLDGSGDPTDADTGEIEWSTDEYAYILTQDAQGKNRLERRVNNVTPADEIVARDVERIVFDDYLTDPTLTLNQLKVTVCVWKKVSGAGPNPEKRGMTVRLSSTVEMRNR